MKTSVVAVVLLTAIIFLFSVSVSAVVYVNINRPGSFPGDGSSWDLAYRGIQPGINKAVAGEEVWVAKGTYNPYVTLKSGVILKGGYAGTGDLRDVKANETTIDTRYLTTYGRPAVAGAPQATIDGFTIKTGLRCGIRADVDMTASNNTVYVAGQPVSDPQMEPYVAISCGGSSAIRNNMLFCGQYGILCSSGSPTITGNAIFGSHVPWTSTGIYCSNSSPLISDNSIVGNETGVWLGGPEPVLINNVIAANVVGVSVEWGSPKLYNNTLARNNVGVTCWFFGYAPTVTVTLVNNILAFCSVAVSSWSSSANWILSHNDVYGNLQDYEGILASPTDISVDPLFASVDFGDFHIRENSLCRDAGETIPNELQQTDFDGQGRISGTAIDVGADESYGETYATPYEQRIIYVNAVASAGGDGASWQTAHQSLEPITRDVLSRGGAEVRVREGTYAGATMPPFCYLYGGFSATSDSAVPDPTAHLTVINSAVYMGSCGRLEGFTVTGGSTGVRCRIARWTTVTRNVIAGHSIDGILIERGAPVVCNNVIRDNARSGIRRDGGAPCTITNNTIARNGSGISVVDGSANIFNNIVALNTRGIEGAGGHYSLVRNNNIFGNSEANYAGNGDISADPMFADAPNGDFHLLPGSPCINAGWNEAPGLPTLDMDGQGRIASGAVDIGADELWPILVQIDIKPGEYPNHINLKSNGLTSVAILTTQQLDAILLDVAKLRFAGAPVATRGKNNKPCAEMVDVDGDGDLDLLLRFETPALSIPPGAVSATLTGVDATGWPIEGTDDIVVVGG